MNTKLAGGIYNLTTSEVLAQLTVLFVCIYGAVCIYQTGATPLYVAAQEGHEAVVSALLAAGADKNLQTKVPFMLLLLIMTML